MGPDPFQVVPTVPVVVDADGIPLEVDMQGMSLIWNRSDVPFDAIRAERQILTPAVGVVRVTLESGELFDGRLYALGENRVWLQSEIGRLALDGSRVTGIDHLDRSGTASPRPDPTEIAMGERVRVRTAGGFLYGSVLKQEQGRVTIMTESGGRITLSDGEPIEAVGTKSRIQLGDVAAEADADDTDA